MGRVLLEGFQEQGFEGNTCTH